jgi:propionate CoA-transferase
VDQVLQITFNGRLAREKGQPVVYVTERGVFHLGREGIVLREIAPGLDLQEHLLSQIGFQVRVADDLKEMDPMIFRLGTMGLKQHEHWRC